MTSVQAWPPVAARPPLLRWRDVPVYAAMLVVMLVTMVGHSTIRDLTGLGVLASTAMLCARVARDDSVFRTHLVDFGAMALVLVGCLPGHVHSGVHDHFSLPSGPIVFAVAIGGWLLGRILLWQRMATGRTEAVVSAALCGTGLVLMVVLCGQAP